MVVVSRNYFPLLDWVRFLAALLVVFYHARPAHWVGWSDLSVDSHRLAAQFFFLLISPGRQAVVVFFVLSGFLVGGRLIQRLRAGTFSLPSYALDRATRILIPLIPSLGVTVISVFLVHRGFPPGFWGQLTCNLGQLQGIACAPLEGNSSLWSLNYEVWFYVVGGLLGTFFLSCRINQFKAWIVWLQGGFLFVGLWALSMLESVYLFAWVIGAIAAIRPFAILGSKSLLVNICWLLLGVGVSQFGGYQKDSAIGLSLYIFGTLIVSLSSASLIPWLISARPSVPAAVMLVELGTPLAAFSYTLYLTHYPILYFMRSLHQPFEVFTFASLLFFFLKILVCLLIAWLLYLPFERNTLKVRHQLALATGLVPSVKVSASVSKDS